MVKQRRYLIALLVFMGFLLSGVVEGVIGGLGLSQGEVAIGLGLAIIASMVALQLGTLSTDVNGGDPPRSIAVGFNLGGVLIPLLFILYLSQGVRYNWLALALLVLGVIAVVHSLNQLGPRHNALACLLAATAVSAIGGLAMGGEHYLVWAYTSAVIGTLIAGLLQLRQLISHLSDARGPILLGDQGVMDAIFLSGMLSMLTAESLLLSGVWKTTV